MKTRQILAGILALGLMVTLMLGLTWAQERGPRTALGTAFTYQGRLTDAGGLVNDQCDFQFSLWDAAGSGDPPSGGTQIGATQFKTNVEVAEGLFTIPDLDFGSTAFAGQARWLEIAMRCPAGDGTYAALAPRQGLTPAPQALYAANAGLLDGQEGAYYLNASNVNAGTLPTDRYSAHADLAVEGYLGNASGDLAQNNGAVQTNLNADLLDGQHAGAFAGASHTHLGETWTGSNNPLKIEGSFAAPDYAALVLSNTVGYGLRVSEAGGVGVAVSSAGQYGVYVSSADEIGMVVDSAGFDGVAVGMVGGVGLYVDSAGSDGVAVNMAGDDGLYVGSSGGDGLHVSDASSAGVYVNSAGNRGVEIYSAAGTGMSVDWAGASGLYVGSAGNYGVYVGSAGEEGVYVGSAGGNGLRVEGAGLNGVETWDTTYDGVQVNRAGRYGVHVHSAGSDAVYVYSAVGNGVAVDSAGGHGVYVGSVDGDGVDIFDATGNGVSVGFAGGSGLYVHSASADGVHVEGASGNGVRVEAADGDGVNVGWAYGDGADIRSVSGNGVRVDGTGLNGVEIWNATYDGYTPDSVYVGGKIDLVGAVDPVIGERFEVDPQGDYEVGDLLVIDPDSPYLMLSSEANDTKVIGVVGPGLDYERGELMVIVFGWHGAKPAEDDEENLRTVARIKVDASYGSIERGDLLTSSPRPGYAMRAQPVEVSGIEIYRPGTIIGKALEPLDSGQGLIEIFIVLQ